MVVDALRRTELRSCRRTSRHAQKALGMIRVRGTFDIFPRSTCALLASGHELLAYLDRCR